MSADAKPSVSRVAIHQTDSPYLAMFAAVPE